MVVTLNPKESNHATYQTLDELVTALSEEERTTYSNIFHSIKIPNSTFEPCSSWSNSRYTRNCLAENEKFELILLCWEEGQKTPIHDHGGEECWVKVIEGELRETHYKYNEDGELKTGKTAVSKTDDISYMIDFMGFHSLENISDGRAMSLHLYAKPIRNCKIFDDKSGQFVRKDMNYCTVAK